MTETTAIPARLVAAIGSRERAAIPLVPGWEREVCQAISGALGDAGEAGRR